MKSSLWYVSQTKKNTYQPAQNQPQVCIPKKKHTYQPAQNQPAVYILKKGIHTRHPKTSRRYVSRRERSGKKEPSPIPKNGKKEPSPIPTRFPGKIILRINDRWGYNRPCSTCGKTRRKSGEQFFSHIVFRSMAGEII